MSHSGIVLLCREKFLCLLLTEILFALLNVENGRFHRIVCGKKINFFTGKSAVVMVVTLLTEDGRLL